MHDCCWPCVCTHIHCSPSCKHLFHAASILQALTGKLSCSDAFLQSPFVQRSGAAFLQATNLNR